MLEFVLRSPPVNIPGYPEWFSSLLASRGADTPSKAEAFLNPSLDQLGDPFAIHGMREACGLIRDAAARHRRAVIYGDYDVDGICACVILRETFLALGLDPLVQIPDRHAEGYGLHREAVLGLAGRADLLITADCGISNTEEVRLARELGMSVIVTDHHLPPAVLPEADAVVNPLLGVPQGLPLCGAGVAWKLSCALLGPGPAQAQLDLAALATIADMVPLTGENRVIAAMGLEAVAGTGRPGLKALMQAAGIPAGRRLSSEQAAFALAPRLNAGGRIADAMDALTLLGEVSAEEAFRLAQRLNGLNEERRREEARVLLEAERMLEEEDLQRNRSIVLAGSGWNIGVVGLAAGRIAEKYGYPTAILSIRGEQYAGSARSSGGIDLYGALASCADALTRFGGHRQAAGMTLPLAGLERFRRRFDEAVRLQLGERDLLPQVFYDSPMPLGAVTAECVRQLEALAPFGTGNPAPAFLARDVALEEARTVGDGAKHLKMRVRSQGAEKEGIFFGEGARLRTLPPSADIVFRPAVNEYRGRVTAQCLIRAMAPGERAFRQDAFGELEAILQDFRQFTSNDEESLSACGDARDLRILGCRGTLLFCRTWETAMAMRLKHRGFDTAVGTASDRRAYNTVLYLAPLRAISVPYEQIVFCDGLLERGEAAFARKLFPQAALFSLPRSEALGKRLEALSLTRADLREAYRTLKKGEGGAAVCLADRGKALAAAAVLEELGLIATTGDPRPAVTMLPLKKCQPEGSRLYRLIGRGV